MKEKSLATLAFLLLTSMPCIAQEKHECKNNAECDQIEKCDKCKGEPLQKKDKKTIMPSFPGGKSALVAWLRSHVKYPAEAQEKHISGKVIVDIVIGTDGQLSNLTIVESPDPILSKAALLTILKMPRWIPGTEDGKPVRVKYRLPINFLPSFYEEDVPHIWE